MTRLFFILSIISGLLLGFSWPTSGFFLFIFIGFVPLLWIEHDIKLNSIKHPYLKVFYYTYIAFFLWNFIAYFWLHNAKRPDGSNAWEAFLIPVFANSLFMSLVFLLYSKIKQISGTVYGLIFFIGIWMVFEKLHLEWSLNWPWLNLGNVFADNHQIIQWYSVTGSFGGSLWVLTVNVLIFYFLRLYFVSKDFQHLKKMTIIVLPILLLPILISIWMYNDYTEPKNSNINVVVVQPELDPYSEKYTKNSGQIVSEFLALAQSKVNASTNFVLTPETAFPGRGSVNSDEIDRDMSINQIKGWLNAQSNKQISFVSGVELEKLYLNEALKSTTAWYHPYKNIWVDHYNSAIEINLKDNIETYDKSKLVPGVEFFPYGNILNPLLGDLMLDFGGTNSGLAAQQNREVFTNSFNPAKIAPIICYEAIYGEYVTEYIKKGANVLFVMSNDSWWGDSDGHRQLLAYSKLRCIETRRSMARSANSGTSAFINQRGDIIQKTKYLNETAISGNIKLNDKLTFYAIYGDYIIRIAMFITGILLAFSISEIILKSIYKKRLKK